MASSNPHVVTTRAEGPLWIVTLQRPSVRNAVTLEMAQQLEAAIIELDQRDDLRVAILTGAGGNFCSGMDLKAFASGERPFLPGSGFAGLTARPPRKPMIAAVEGYALAGGLEIALSCDLIVASRAATFGIPEVKRGIAAIAGGLLRLPIRIPRALAMELALTGRFVEAEEASTWGLLNRVVEPGEALAVACQLGLDVAANAPLAVEASKQVILASRAWPEDEMFERQAPLVERVMGSEDGLEGARAFAEKRAPV